RLEPFTAKWKLPWRATIQPLTPAPRRPKEKRRPRGDLAGRLAATLNNSLKGRLRDRLRSRSSQEQMQMDFPDWHPETRLVHGGTLRSQFGETSEALFLTQGYVYESAEAAEGRFKGEVPGFVYSRFANPTVNMFERRMCAIEGAEDARATASGMAAVAAALLCHVNAGDHVVGARSLFGSCHWI